jgi:hypothetical protein
LRKTRLGIDWGTQEVRAVAVTASNFGGAHMLLDQIPLDQDIAIVTISGVYDARKLNDAIVDRNADAFVPPRESAKP